MNQAAILTHNDCNVRLQLRYIDTGRVHSAFQQRAWNECRHLMHCCAESTNLSLVHEVVNEAVLLPVDAVDLPRQLVLSPPLVLLVHGLLHLLGAGAEWLRGFRFRVRDKRTATKQRSGPKQVLMASDASVTRQTSHHEAQKPSAHATSAANARAAHEATNRRGMMQDVHRTLPYLELKIFNDLLDELPPFRRLLVLQPPPVCHLFEARCRRACYLFTARSATMGSILHPK